MDTITPALIATLLAIASQLSGYPAPSEVPDVVRLPPTEIRHRVCEHSLTNDPTCGRGVAGFYPVTGGPDIFIDRRLDPSDPITQSVIVHEMVHYLQHEDVLVRKNISCKDLIRAETEAYTAQHKFLIERGIEMQMPVLTCKEVAK